MGKIKNRMSIQTIKQIADSPATELGTTILDSLQTVPLGGIVLATIKVGVGVADYMLFKKFAYFLSPMKEREEDVNVFLEKLSPSQYEKLGDYMLSLLSNAESSDKAKIMGLVFKSAVIGEIDYDMMLRLISIIGRSFIPDLRELRNYIEESQEFSVAANSFINLGLIDNETGGYWKNEPTIALNEVGRALYRILERGGWFEN